MRLFKRLIAWLKGLLKVVFGRLFRRVKAEPKSLLRKQIAIALSAYLGLSLPMTYAMTALTTPAKFTDPASVVRVASAAGLPNVLTLGLGMPAVKGVEGAVGRGLSHVGDVFGLPDVVKEGQRLIEDASTWFDQGLGLVSEYEIPTLDLQFTDTAPHVVTDVDARTAEAEGWTPWDESQWPDYVRIAGKAEVRDRISAGNKVFLDVDSLGRPTGAGACVTWDMVQESAGKRASFAEGLDDALPGWGHNTDHDGDGRVDESDGHDYDGDGVTDRKDDGSIDTTVRIALPNGKTYNGWFWNRSHLLADRLGGYVTDGDGNDVTPVENVITGTRTQNVGANDLRGGMAFCEETAYRYLQEHTLCSVYYFAEPVYHGDELIPRSVIVDMLSCDGGLDMRVEVFNCAKGYDIDYMTGTFSPVRTD